MPRNRKLLSCSVCGQGVHEQVVVTYQFCLFCSKNRVKQARRNHWLAFCEEVDELGRRPTDRGSIDKFRSQSSGRLVIRKTSIISEPGNLPGASMRGNPIERGTQD